MGDNKNVCTCGHPASFHTIPKKNKPRGICWASNCGCMKYEESKA